MPARVDYCIFPRQSTAPLASQPHEATDGRVDRKPVGWFVVMREPGNESETVSIVAGKNANKLFTALKLLIVGVGAWLPVAER